jgi:ribosomal protein L23
MAIFSSKKEEEKKDAAPAEKKVIKKAEKKAKPAVSKPAAKADKKHAPEFKGNAEGAYELIIHRPRITEKAALVTGHGVYVFDVSMRATKKDIATAIREHYKVTPLKVHIVRLAPRKLISRARNRRGQTSGLKKAYVYLKKGERIDIM